MRSISFGSTFSSNVAAFTVQGSTLTIGAGGMTNMGENVTHSIQNNIVLSAQQKWTSTWGNLIVSGSINTNGNLLIVGGGRDSATITLSGAISGSGGLMKTDSGGVLVLSGNVANTFTGTTTVDSRGTMELAKSDGVNAIAGPLSTRGTVRLGANNQIADTSTVGISDGGILAMNGFTEAIGSLSLNGGYITGGGTLIIGGNVTANSILGPGWISANLDLGGAIRTFTVYDNPGVALTVEAPLFNGGIIKAGTGTIRLLSPSPAYSGPTNVTAGTLVVNGSISGSAVTVGSGATLSGSGSVGPVFISGGNLVPGDAVGTLTTGSLTLASGASLRFELAAPGAVGGGVNDLLSVGGNLTLDGTLIIIERTGFGSGTYRLFSYTGTLIDNGLVLQSTFLAAHPGSTINTATTGQVNLVVAPEPSSVALMALGAAVLQKVRRRGSRRLNRCV